MRLAAGCQFAEVGATAFGGYRATFSPQNYGCWQLGLGDETVGKGECRVEEFAAVGSSVFGQIGRGKDEIGFGYQPFQGI